MNKKRLVVLVMTIMMIVGVMTGCGEKTLADNFKEEEVQAKAEEVIESLNAYDYEKTESFFSEEMKEVLPVEKLEESIDGLLKGAGAFVEYQSKTVVGATNKNNGDDNAVAIIKVKYENKKYQYTVSFDPNMEVNGLYMK